MVFLSPPVILFTDCSKAVLLSWIRYVIFVSCLSLLCCLVFPYILVITCWEKADLLALLCVLISFVFVTSPYGVQGQMCYLLVSIYS